MARKPREAPPAPMVVKTGGRLSPVSPVDAELLEQTADGQIFELVPRKSDRSNKQNKWYWCLLGKIVDGTGAWPSSKHLHREILSETGHTTEATKLRTGEKIKVPNSTAFEAMTPAEFNGYLDRALAVLSETFGFDVTELMPPKEKQ